MIRLVIALIFAVVGSILIGSTVHQLGPIGNGLIRVLGVILLISAINIVRKQRNGKQGHQK
ncbi:hypothetical protein DYI25_12235 [Mesobacillus boroniphilus]|uniref:Uncharacterized protein n=1 Tax=Mesobacillus boroniphilus TaxID=308892 RepID=A0A944CLF9_9BACI|nr:hypothetical protein [Mesobacillus boroniphilus]MBS8265213.1 hypothetical protein [Mesobacillus boroniphilus]